MKKTLLILAIALSTLSCSSDDGGVGVGGINSNLKFNPPTWIQGTWFEVNDPDGFTFTSDDILRLILDENNNIVDKFSNKEFYRKFVEPALNVVESINDNSYKARVDLSNSDAPYIVNLNKKSTDTIYLGTSSTYIRQ